MVNILALIMFFICIPILVIMLIMIIFISLKANDEYCKNKRKNDKGFWDDL